MHRPGLPTPPSLGPTAIRPALVPAFPAGQVDPVVLMVPVVLATVVPVVPAAVRKAAVTMAAPMVSADTVPARPDRTCLSLTSRCTVCN